MDHDTSSHFVKGKQLGLFRRKGTMDRASYLVRAKELAPRGSQLPQTKLTPDDVRRIRAMKERRERLRAMINDRYSNEAIAEIFGVSKRCIEEVFSHRNHSGVI